MENNKIGQILAQKRSKINLTTLDIANKIKIKEEYIKAIEDNNLDILPKTTYIKGVILQYCKILDLDIDDLKKKEEISAIEDENLKKSYKNHSFNSNSKVSFSPNSQIIVISIIFFLILTFIMLFYNSFVVKNNENKINNFINNHDILK